ncbi:17029_t:CDS:2 [Acaulospora morrowiae]|uniref:17029_t:CDS:1 n=1 Tax=Acaulospora morrowiae TaxID=94023 RepID=A0A9N9AQN7_9GLOM|nr:17029_t:CDS:2 [Acaulospora morrowiae]
MPKIKNFLNNFFHQLSSRKNSDSTSFAIVESNKNNEQREIGDKSKKNNEHQEIDVESNENNKHQEANVETNKNNNHQEIEVESNKNNEHPEIKVEGNKNNEHPEIEVEINKNNEHPEIKVESNKNNEHPEIEVEDNKNNEQQEIEVEINKNNEHQEIEVEGNKNNEHPEIEVESNKNNKHQEIEVESNKNNEHQEIEVESNKNNEHPEIEVEGNKNNEHPKIEVEHQEIVVEINKNNEHQEIVVEHQEIVIEHQEIVIEGNKNNEHPEIEAESNKNNEHQEIDGGEEVRNSKEPITHDCGRNKVEEWCEKCDRELFQSNFSKWTSGNEHIDAFIRETQLSATTKFNFLEWIPFDQLTDIERIGSGGFGEVFSARWIAGPRSKWNAEKSTWERYPNVKVALKSLIKLKEEDVTGDLFKELLHHMKANTQVSGRITTLRTYGMSYDPEQKAYMIVMLLADEGDLGAYLKSNFSSLTYIKRLEILYDIASGLVQMHKSGLVHRDLHSGNVLCTRYKNEEENRDDYRCVIVSGAKSFGDVEHGTSLALEICSGRRPEIIPNTPKSYADLMKRCWDGDREKRPSAWELHSTIGIWLNQCLFSPNSDIAEEFARGEEHRLKEPLLQVLSPSYSQHSVFLHVNAPPSSEIPVEDYSNLSLPEIEIDMSDD